MYGMWMRFWKGTGHPWPATKILIREEDKWQQADRCEPTHRDEHIFIQNSALTSLKESYEKDLIVKNFIEKLPYVEYDFYQ